MFKKLGLGLDANEKYQRAFEKGVLLGPPKFGEAAIMFWEAAKEFEKRGDGEGQRRAMANAKLYEYLSTGKTAALDATIALLAPIREIERVGTASEIMPAARLALELQARRAEIEAKANDAQSDWNARALAHDFVCEKFEAIKTETLVTYTYLSEDAFRQTAESRLFLHAGHASWARANAKMTRDPGAAAEEMSRAVLAYRRAGFKEGEDSATTTLANLRVTRTCWVCGREMQGQGVNFYFLSSTVFPYHAAVLEKARQDSSMLLLAQSQVAVCVVCKGIITAEARSVAQEIARQIATEMIVPLAQQVNILSQAVDRLARQSHHH